MVIELKFSSVDIGDGLRQLISNREEIFHPGFFSTVQLVRAGSDSQGLRYGTTGTTSQVAALAVWARVSPPQCRHIRYHA